MKYPPIELLKNPFTGKAGTAAGGGRKQICGAVGKSGALESGPVWGKAGSEAAAGANRFAGKAGKAGGWSCQSRFAGRGLEPGQVFAKYWHKSPPNAPNKALKMKYRPTKPLKLHKPYKNTLSWVRLAGSEATGQKQDRGGDWHKLPRNTPNTPDKAPKMKYIPIKPLKPCKNVLLWGVIAQIATKNTK